MSKASGGTRNYNGTPTYSKRKDEYGSLMSNGEYSQGHLYRSGGFYVIHKDHRPIEHSNKDYSDVAARKLAEKGYKVYLEAEKSYILGQGVNDGFVYKTRVDFKTVSELGKNTIKSAMEKASKQGAEAVVVYQRRKAMTRTYVENQIKLFTEKSPKKAREKIKEVIVVGLSGNIHRHKL